MMECEIPEFYTHTEPVARKNYRCCECRAPILPGEKHFHGRGKWDGEISTHRQHLLCMELCMLIRDEFEGECIPFGGLKSWYGEYRHDVVDGRKPEQARLLLRLMAKIRHRERKAR